MNHYLPLSHIPIGRKARVINLELEGFSRRRILDMGLVPGTEVEVLRRSPLGDPTAYLIRGTVIGLRKDEASHIIVQKQ
ncbi:ferrous iron transport protein A [Heliobacterium chlorum]|uniref:Ferrous iron transport protein A n=1 Tax=Heliobacterium chlorum TaxID=2698 RepID=A0ABR7T5G7_HELCL|nr:FeoA family protein [Heliobacterium chlorum]MBC9784806.1 ferrous iron transport protein A [Heliobacterium chlorum]